MATESEEDIRSRIKRLESGGLRTFVSERPLVIDRASGAWLYDPAGKGYLDFGGSFAVTTTGHCHPRVVAAIREQGGVVYLPHPFDRLHTIPDAGTLHRHLAEIDIFEVYNARLLFEGYNDEALRFARKYNLTMGAGSDAHVLQGVGTGLVRMRAFETPEEFLISLRSAEILRRPKSLLYLQGLKWVAQARERRTKASVR